MQVKSTHKIQCYHCGDDCLEDLLAFDNKNFCCIGCKVVYQVLSENQLCDYYNFEKNPGATLKDYNPAGDRYNFLDNTEIADALISFRENNICRVNFYVPKIHCSSCIWLLENLQKLDEGIHFSRVNFEKKEVSVAFDCTVTSLKTVAEILHKIGYEPQISLDSISKKDNRKNSKKEYYQLGILGFCFGNIMLLSFPEYLGLEDSADNKFKDLFGYLNIIFSLPIMYIAYQEYIVASVKSIKNSKVISLDVPIALGILALFFTSVYEIIFNTGAGYMDSFAGLLFFLLLGKLFQKKTYSSLSFDRDFRSYFPISVNKIEADGKKAVPLKDLKIGDKIEIHHQELIPVDSYIDKGDALIDYSFITGETEPVVKHPGDKVFAGGKQMGGNVYLLVEKEFSQSNLVSLWNNEVFEKSDENYQSLTDIISKYFTVGVIIISLGSLLYWLPAQPNIALKSFVSVLIVACPCALALSAPFTLGSLLRVYGRFKLFLKNAIVAEKISKIDTIVFDKTGTLTSAKKSFLEYEGAKLSLKDMMMINSLSAQSMHPLSKQIRAFYAPKNLTDIAWDSFEEFAGLGIVGKINRDEIKIGSAVFLDLNIHEIPTANVYISINGQYKGCFILKSYYRNGISKTISELSKEYKLYVLSGDNNSEEYFLKQWFGKDSQLLFNQSPKNKLEFIEKLKSEGKNVMMIGDGLNDAGALKASDVGIAITEEITSFSPSSDGILDSSQIHNLPKFLKLSKNAISIRKLSLVLSILYNAVGLSFAVRGALTPVISAILMPLSSITIVAFTTLSVLSFAYFKNFKKTE